MVVLGQFFIKCFQLVIGSSGFVPCDVNSWPIEPSPTSIYPVITPTYELRWNSIHIRRTDMR